MPKRAIKKLQRGQTVLEKFNLVTIFFSDIVGYTSMASKMRPLQVMAMLNELYTEFDKLVEKHKVYKVEVIQGLPILYLINANILILFSRQTL